MPSEFPGKGRPTISHAFIVEIAGIPGVGKSTLAENLTRALRSSGVAAVSSRDFSFHGNMQMIEGGASVVGDMLRLTRFFVLGSGGAKLQTTFMGVHRLLRATRPAFARRVMALQSSRQVVVQEPGWQMQLISHLLYFENPIDQKAICNFSKLAPRSDLTIYLRAEPEIATDRMSRRPRGIPRRLRKFTHQELQLALLRAGACSAALASVQRTLGRATLEIDATDRTAEDVARMAEDAVLAQMQIRRSSDQRRDVSVEGQ
jgi:thymidylate kinase